jgi:hypothetical protein
MAKGRLDGTYRKRGEYAPFWRDRAFDLIFNGSEWTCCETIRTASAWETG